MDVRIEDARTYYVQTKQTLYMLFGSLWAQVVQKEEFETTHARQKADIAFLEGHGNELREAANETLIRQRAKLIATEGGINASDLAINILAGTVLQIAKQAISIRHGADMSDCKLQGRLISGSCVRDLIWIGRNQAMHFEETNETKQPGVRKSGWVDLFKILDTHRQGTFSLAPPHQSKAFEILQILGWSRFDQYESDMQDLGVDPTYN